MKQFVLLALIAVVAAETCIPKPVSNVHPPPPPSVSRVTSAASVLVPSLQTDISIIEALTLSSPTFGPIESIIESYAQSHEDTISLLEYYELYPSAVTSPTQEASIETDFPTLATAVVELVSVEESHTSLLNIQSSLQSLMAYYSSIVTDGATSFEFSHGSLISAESGISEVAISTPSIVTDVEVLTTIISIDSALTCAESELTDAAYYYSTVLHDITTAQDWTDTSAWVIDTTLQSIATCYPTVYHAIVSFDDFLSSHGSDTQAFSELVTALTYVPSIITDVVDFVTSVSTSFTQAVADISPAVYADTHITTEISYLDVIEAQLPSLSCAESDLEHQLVSEASVISILEVAYSSPSAVTNSAYIVSLEELYPSIESAITEIETAISWDPSLSYVQSQLTQEELIVPDLLTDANEVISATSPGLIGDVSELDKVEYISPSIVTALHSLKTIIQASPSLSCDEDVVAQYAISEPTILYTIAVALDSPSQVSATSLPYIAQLTAEYTGLASALRSIDSIEYTFPQLAYIQDAISFALTYEPSLLYVYSNIDSYDLNVEGEVCSFVPSFSS